ncbi:MAG: hypothetical protein BRC36_13250 [Cyanobacteria bacterium QH_2_48_84]|nr:MAG: hypothetical protein BRC36_13250 [Cyanobacteria bacterium QH_2_48_84]
MDGEWKVDDLYKWRSQANSRIVEAQSPRPPIPHQKIRIGKHFENLWLHMVTNYRTEQIAPKWGNISRHTIARGLKNFG